MEPLGDPARYTLAATNNPLSKLSCVLRDSVRGIPFGKRDRFPCPSRGLIAPAGERECTWQDMRYVLGYFGKKINNARKG